MDAAQDPGEWYLRIAREFLECPGLRLTAPQAARLWGLDPDRVEELLTALVGDGLLVRRGTTFLSPRGCPTCG